MMTRERFLGGLTFDQMVAAATKNVDLWTLTRRRATADPAFVAATEALGEPFHLLVLSEDWCIDSVSSLPFIDALASTAQNLELRILERDRNLDLMDAHLFKGKSRSIPCVIVYDEQFVERGWWGPRPAELQRLVEEEWADLSKVERVAEERRWYARDRGVSPVREVVELLQRVATTSTAAPVGAQAPDVGDATIASASAE